MPISPMNRRQFMHKSAVTGAAVAAAGTVAAAPAQAADRASGAHCKPPRTWTFSISSTNEIRQLMIDYVTSKGSLNPAGFAVTNWKLTQGGTAVFAG